jgi:hypothetical protein
MRWVETGALLLGITACGFSPGSGDDGDLDLIDAAGGGDANGGEGDAAAAFDSVPPIDAQPPPNCPGAFVLERDGSRYFVSSGQATWAEAESECESASPGQAHLAVINDGGELGFFRDQILVLSFERYHVGVVRDDDSGSVNAWRYVTGGAATWVPWREYYVGPPDEPNNGLGTPPSEPVAVLDNSSDLNYNPTRGGFVDVTTLDEYRYICECDGLPPVDATYVP